MTTNRGRVLPPVIVGGALATAMLGGVLVAPPSVPGVLDSPVTVRVALAVLRTLLDLSVGAMIGVALIPLLATQKRIREATTSPRLYRSTAVAVPVVALALIVVQSVDFRPGQPPDVGEQIATEPGAQALLVVAGLGALALGLGSRYAENVPAEVRLAVAVCAAVPPALTGHLGGEHGQFAPISLVLHVVGAFVWTGGLLATGVLCLGLRERLCDVLPRFSALAGGCFAVVVASGVTAGVTELSAVPGQSLPALLVSTDYGRLLLLKAACLVVAGLAAAHLRLRVLPLVRRRKRVGFTAWIGGELLVLGVATGAAAVLARAPITPS